MLEWSFKWVSMVFQKKFKKFEENFKGVSRIFKEVFRVLQGIEGSSESPSWVIQGRFKGI